MTVPTFDLHVDSPDVQYSENYIDSTYVYRTTEVSRGAGGRLKATPRETTYNFRTERTVPRLGCMLVGWGGNNGSTVTAATLANRFVNIPLSLSLSLSLSLKFV